MRSNLYKSIAFVAALGLSWSAGTLASNLPAHLTGVTPKATGASIVVTEAFTDCRSITIRGTITFTATTDDDGSGNDFVWLVVWDDGEVKSSDWSASLPVGTTETLPFDITYGDPTVGQDAQGIGVYLYDLDGQVGQIFSIDPQDVEGEELCDGTQPPVQTPATAVPLGGPASLGLMGLLLGAVGLGWMRRRANNA